MLFTQLAQRWLALALCVLLSGCTVCKNVKRTVITEPKAFSSKKDRVHSKKLYRSWANRAWKEHCAAVPEMRGANNYRAGFKDGFVDLVFAGGSGEPPPVPPRRFWNADLRSPSGHNGASQWFEGFRDGARYARTGGFRDQAIIQSSFRSGVSEDYSIPQYPESNSMPYEPVPYENQPTPLEELSPPVEMRSLPLESKLLKSELLKSEMPLNPLTRQQPPKADELKLVSAGDQIAIDELRISASDTTSEFKSKRVNPFRDLSELKSNNLPNKNPARVGEY